MISSFFDKISVPVKSLTYEKPQTPQTITGELMKKNGREVQVRISDSRIVKAMLRQEIQEKPGEMVSIDRKNIEEMEVKKAANKQMAETEGQKGKEETDKVLERFQIKANQESREALETLQNHGVEITRGNIMTFMTSKQLLSKVMEDFNPQKALALIEKNIDLDRSSLQELAQLLKETPEKAENFSFLKWLGLKKEMTTEEAEKVARKLYGSKMGKDVTDTIKALDRMGMNVTKSRIDSVQQIMDKVYALRELREEILLEPLKGKMEPTLDTLYKLNKGLATGGLPKASEEGEKQMTSYHRQHPSSLAVTSASTLSAADLERMEEDIARQLRAEGLEVNEERMVTAKSFLKNNVPVTAENIQRMEALKEAVKTVTDKLDPEKVAAMQKAGINAEKTDVTEIARWLQEYENRSDEKNGETSRSTDSESRTGEEPLQKMNGKEKEAILKKLEQQMEKLGKLDEKQLLKLVRQGGDLKLSHLAPIAEKVTITNLSQADQQVLKMAELLGRLNDFSLEAAAHHQRQQAPMTLESLVQSQQLVADHPEKALPPESRTPEGAEKAQQVMETYLVQRGASAHALQQHTDFEAARALSLQQLPLTEERIAQLYELRGAVENMQQNMTVEDVQKLQRMDSFALDQVTLNQAVSAEYGGKMTASLGQLMERMEVVNTLQQIQPETLAFHEKQNLPMTAVALELTQQWIKGEITEATYRKEMNEMLADMKPATEKTTELAGQKGNEGQQINQSSEKLPDKLPEGITKPREVPAGMDTLISRHLQEMMPHLGRESEEMILAKQAARALMVNEMPLSRENLQQMMQILKQQEIIQTNSSQVVREAPEDIDRQTSISQLSQMIRQMGEVSEKSEARSVMIPGETDPGTSRNHELQPRNITPEQMERLNQNMTVLKALASDESRQDSVLSLMVKNAMPVNLEEVRQTGLFLQNKNQIGQLLGELTERLLQYSDKPEHPVRQAALQLQELMQQAGDSLRKGQPPAPDLYRQIGNVLQGAEQEMASMSSGDRESFGRSAEQLMNALQLQSQLNREDAVYQLPFMMNGEAKNLQMFFMNDQKGKKIDPKDMSVLFNFETSHLGNLNIFVGVKYKKIVMKMGVEKEEDRQWMESFSEKLHETMEELGYEIKDFSFRVEEEQHTLSLADEVQKFRGLRSSLLDLQI
ncbi:DUF6240 domain-containing protein [Tindallia californiensis]|uniref:Hook-length control protein FliK n=1 Tax=Tindallia californiensis TaxID=159292 RepID=A0A1H3LA38_9FIRM|nr:DUF6240 domain-containing protein [Tindallia californiensis]SDY60824.1 hypothetical protein SAMN05192546_103114 [Tindallia californiensis]